MRKQKKRTLISVLLIAELIALAFVAGLFIRSYNNVNRIEPAETQATTDTEESNGTDELLTTLLFASDYQFESGWDLPRDSLSKIIDVSIADGKTIDGVIMCGDYSNEYKKIRLSGKPRTINQRD